MTKRKYLKSLKPMKAIKNIRVMEVEIKYPKRLKVRT